MEEMEEVWRRPKLNDEEDCPIEIQKKWTGVMRGKGDRSLIGKIVLERRIGKDTARIMMERVWKVVKPLEFQEIDRNCYVITFVSRRDKLRVMNGCPWLFENHLFVLKEFDGETQPSMIDFDHAFLWIQMLNLPLSYMNKMMGEVIGRSMGEVVEVDVLEDGSGWGRCLRVKVEYDLRKPLARGRTIVVDGKTCWVPFQYEKLPRMCFKCGRIVHEKEGCKESAESSSQYSVWLRAITQLRKTTVQKGEQKEKEKREEREDQGSQNLNIVKEDGVFQKDEIREEMEEIGSKARKEEIKLTETQVGEPQSPDLLQDVNKGRPSGTEKQKEFQVSISGNEQLIEHLCVGEGDNSKRVSR
ncbi:uncharacterized protein LOC122316186 [Carya illinoinensis]|uniref:uncharacterized protein LOC122316186 n=1 Tax=Carya illinoinensis TaxID=32201 RepID=UPI001C71AA01|nr:uncharacterized protein LOC122316186 [Carya illinoinensis]